MPIHIIKETKNWIVVDKPAGIQVERNPFGDSAESLVHEHLETAVKKPYIGIVHRLDRVTTGVVLMAKRKPELRRLNQQFMEKKVRKIYLAAVEQPVDPEQGRLQHWLEKDLIGKRALVHNKPGGKAKECMLDYETLPSTSNDRTFLQLTPVTGRYHQIRAQLAAAGAPIIGDAHYGSHSPYEDHHIMLHAWKLAFFDEQTQEEQWIEAPLPDWATSLKL
ncbi:MAG: RluA family pseudouridine synthase [Phaeodactylibacter sp.]|nr:RluA family pseudouridine synthase [Phaeodactylibacter sp.]